MLAIEDDPAVQRALRRTFETAGFDITIAPDGTSAMDVFRATLPRVVILDLRLPGRSGQDLCREIKRQAATVPILVLSAASDVVDKVLLLELGADDYVTKPFSPRELLARVRAAIRRLNQHPDKREQFSFDDVEVNFSKMELSKAGKLVPLTPQEFKMLRFFLNNEERVVSRAELLTKCGATIATPRPAPWIFTFCACGRSSRPTPVSRCISARFTARDTSSCASPISQRRGEQPYGYGPNF